MDDPKRAQRVRSVLGAYPELVAVLIAAASG